MNFHDDLKITMHKYVKMIYNITKSFPKDELYGITSQIRRSSMSVILNYIEGYARRKGVNCKVYINFLEISYGSLKESKYLLYFSYEQGLIKEIDYKEILKLNDKVGKMLWSIIKK
ncbi:four helix bundle protein [Candidatus Falkowbacteria bacterium]|uniref:Four helix bundle protein n=1 Tax=Candidatus Buchananbacteria bacterium CG10_big_fil_rev_8_21_14_0_10_33_19 TaxID=1974525 RepID=A0A2H0W4F9_9BACT|nr:four helix bundle protein [Candidatus Falkowbacteria bacterium]PIS06238.1 MAG: four helix bundle protein [Candidatus Buchananbacteria bacterium CG10_big_fil_rev_8_21_14_0_10_33_19]